MDDAATVEPALHASEYREHVAELERRYAATLAEHGLDALIIHSGTPIKRAEADDQFWPLRPVPHFQHWLPLAAPDCALVIRPGTRPLLVWPRPPTIWESEPNVDADATRWRDSFDVVEVTSAQDARAYLPREGAAAIGERRAPPPWLPSDVPLNPPDLVQALDELRVRKTVYEVRCIAEANRRAALGHRAVAQAFQAGDQSELALHLLFLGATGQDDPETPYKNIVALGPHAATLHHIVYGRTASARPAESLLIDAGASFQGYTSDITRTHVKGNGATADAFGELLRRVDAMQQRLCAQVEIGLPYPMLHERAHQAVAEILSEMRIVRLGADQIVEQGITRAFFPHGLGHSLGLQCHDVGCAETPPTEATDWLRNTRPIEQGQVFTIEPGVYFIPGRLEPLAQGPHAGSVDWPLVRRLGDLGGVRIEDDVHVAGGSGVIVNLTREHVS